MEQANITFNAPINLTAPCIIFTRAIGPMNQDMGPIALVLKKILPAKIMHRAVKFSMYVHW